MGTLSVGLDAGDTQQYKSGELKKLIKSAGYQNLDDFAKAVGVAAITARRWSSGATRPEREVMPKVYYALREVISEYDLYVLMEHHPPRQVEASDEKAEWCRIYDETPPSKRRNLMRLAKVGQETLCTA